MRQEMVNRRQESSQHSDCYLMISLITRFQEVDYSVEHTRELKPLQIYGARNVI